MARGAAAGAKTHDSLGNRMTFGVIVPSTNTSVQAEFDAFMVRRRAMAEQRIAQAEATALAEVRGAAVDAAVKAAEIVLQSELKGSKGDAIVTSGLKDVAANLR